MYDQVTWGSGGYLPTTSPLRLHVLRDGAESDVVARSTIPIFTAAPTYYILTYFFIKQLFKNFLVPFRGPPGLDARIFELLSSRHLPRNFSRLSTSSLTNGFTQALPTSNVTPTPTPYSDSPPRVTYPRIFPRLYLIFSKGFTQALPPCRNT